ncbi:hypothetical protein BH09SUM1_BH09SUM1_16910 [soil metagenome]
MGHADVDTTMRYIAYSPDYASAFGAKMPDFSLGDFDIANAATINELTGGSPPRVLFVD